MARTRSALLVNALLLLASPAAAALPKGLASAPSTLPALPNALSAPAAGIVRSRAIAPGGGMRGGAAVSKADGVRTILGGAIIHLVFGSLYCWGNFQAYAPGSLKFFDGGAHPGAAPDILTVCA